MDKKGKILIVEDDKTIREELQMTLMAAGYEARIMEDFSDPAGSALAVKPDLILLDVNLQKKSGLAICEEIRQYSQVPVIFVTATNTPIDELNGMLRGRDDYVSKPYQLPVLLARIGAVLRRTFGNGAGAPQKTEYKGIVLDIAAACVCKGSKKCDLTKNEMKILHCLFEHPGDFVSRTDIIDYLWDNEVFIDDNTLSVNVTRIRNKLKSIGAGDFIETKRGLGYRIG